MSRITGGGTGRIPEIPGIPPRRAGRSGLTSRVDRVRRRSRPIYPEIISSWLSPPPRRALGATALLGKGLTPGKLRGLQRISNPNGTLTMLALDQNSSMIEMAQKALKAKGQDREPTYEEIVEAKLDMMRQMAPAASGVLIDAYYGAWPAIASEAIPRRQGDAGPGREVGQPEEQGRRPDGRDRAGLVGREDQAHGRRRRQAARPVRAGRAGLGRASVRADPARLRRVPEVRHPVPARAGRLPLQRREEDRQVVPRPQGRDGHRVGPADQPATATSTRPSSPAPSATSRDEQLEDNLHALSEASERPWVLLSAGVDYPDYLKQVEMAMECGCSGVLGGRAFWKEYFLQDGAEARTKFAATEGLKRVAEVDAVVREHGTPWFAKYGLTQEDLPPIRAAEGWHTLCPPRQRRRRDRRARRPGGRGVLRIKS